MNNINEEFDNLNRILKMLAAQFGNNSEFILHDLRREYEHTIVAIENNSITGRQVGDGGTNLGLEVLRHPPNADGDLFNYVSKTEDGRLLRSSTMYFRDADGNVIGSLCINTDITDYVNMQTTLQDLAMFPATTDVKEVFTKNVGDLLEYLIEQSRKIVDKPGRDMTKDEKVKVVQYLDEKGFFLITRAGDRVCEYLDISKFTLYKYLGAIRGNGDCPPADAS
ncbi:MAG: helix-turn-helix transcriptional regulator [Planctomycetes bacterium]|nr:helix-turn-helix transcriptional regulator [Planctomycetota bacterium]